MRYLDGFRDPRAARALVARLHDGARRLPAERRSLTFMEVCGSHTMAIARYAIRDVLPPGIELVSGPGCPVCVTPPGYIDASVALAERGYDVMTFGDMLDVPGSTTSLAGCRAKGHAVRVVSTPRAALDAAARHPEREVVFLAIGFETTVAPVTDLVPSAARRGLRNLSLLTAFKTVPPALDALIADPEIRIDGLLCPAHVSAVIGADAYRPYAERHGMPCVIAGFEPLDILYGLTLLVQQVADGVARVDNPYARVVTPQGNTRAQRLIAEYLEPVDADWRGLGRIPRSGLALRAAFAHADAARRFDVTIGPGTEAPGCRCGDVIKGQCRPVDCPCFGNACTPERPVGPCMVSAEGACAAWRRYALKRAPAPRRPEAGGAAS